MVVITDDEGAKAGVERTADALKVIVVNSSGDSLNINPSSETFNGSDATGSDGTTNRIITLSNTSTSSNESVFVDGLLKTSGTDYNVSHSSSNSTVTLLKNIFDSQRIRVNYYV